MKKFYQNNHKYLAYKLVHSKITEVFSFLWTADYDMTQPYSGTIRDLTKFDAGFFGVPPIMADVMDPQLRMLMEATCETFVDAGKKNCYPHFDI